jgi:hypothetical protein
MKQYGVVKIQILWNIMLCQWVDMATHQKISGIIYQSSQQNITETTIFTNTAMRT